jgi:hypothetical protein
MVISVEAERVENALLLHCFTSEVALDEPEIGRTDPNIPIANNRTDDELHFGMPGGSGDFEDEGDKSDAIPTDCRRQLAATELESCDLGTSDVDRYEGEVGDDADADEGEEASQADDGSMQTVED